MTTIRKIVEYIVPKTLELSREYIPDEEVKINYSAIFCQNDEEYERLRAEASELGRIVYDTPTGPLYKLQKPLETPAGPLWLLKVRKPDSTRQQRGDADFTLENQENYEGFKEKYLRDAKHFKLIEHSDFEMVELRDPNFDVLVYFSNPPLTEQFGVKLF